MGVLLALGLQRATAADLGRGALPINYQPTAPMLSETSVIEISGTAREAATIALRVDDSWNANFANRVNLEHPVGRGAFSWRVTTAQLRTGDGRPLDLKAIKQIVLFAAGGGPVDITSFQTISSTAAGRSPAGRLATPQGAVVASSDLGRGNLPINYQPTAPILGETSVIEVTGTARDAATIALRVDDSWNASFANRVNLEHAVGRGTFSWRVTAAQLRTGDGRPLDLKAIKQVVLFAASGGPVQITSFRTIGSTEAAGTAAPSVAAAPPGAEGAELGRGVLPITYQPTGPFLGEVSVIEVAGVARGNSTIVLRVDDSWNAGFADRVNLEHPVGRGTFSWRVSAAQLRTGNGRPLDLKAIKQVVLFAASGGPVEITRFVVMNGISAGDPTGPSGATARASVSAANPAPMSLGSGVAPIRLEPRAPVDASGRELVLEGTIEGKEAQSVLVRIDDTQSVGYPSRVNIERTFPAGPFQLRIGLDGLRTTNGRTLDIRQITRIVISPWPENRNLRLTRADLRETVGLPDGAKGYALGAADATLPSAFERLAPGDPRLSGQDISPRRRSKPDPLVANGLRGLSRIRLAAAPGRVRVTVWSEDPGEWDYIPQVLRRTISVNKVVLVDERVAPGEWVSRRYLRGMWNEHDARSDAWTAYGVHRGDRRTVEVDVGQGGIEIEIDGDSPESRFVSAVLVEDAKSSRALEQVELERADWYRGNWRVSLDVTSDPGVVSKLGLAPVAANSAPRVLSAKVAAGTGTRLTLEATADVPIANPVVTIVEPRRREGGPALPVQLWAGLWRLAPLGPGDTLLALADDQLMSDVGRMAIGGGSGDLGARPRRYEIWVEAPADAPAGLYRGSIRFGAGAGATIVDIDIKVLATRLPEVTKPAGFYLAYPAHLQWLGATRLDRERQGLCDLQLMARFGLTGSAPPVTAPLGEVGEALIGEMEVAIKTGMAPGFLLYNPLGQVRSAQGVERAARAGASAIAALGRRKIPLPVWTGVDEPSNPEQLEGGGVEAWVKALRAASPSIRLAGHLNTPSDASIAHLFDVVVVNDGFGLDAATLARTARAGRSVWIYNTFQPRLTAGFWLTYTAAERYVQWHGRMPTADPFDPLDGRELDIQMIYPSATICEPKPNIHRDLLRMAEGVVDQRWLLWLASRREAAATKLAAELRRRVGDTWPKGQRFAERDLAEMRNSVIAVAESLP